MIEEGISLAEAIKGFKIHIQAARMSENTIRDYTGTLKKFEAFFGDGALLADITSQDINEFLASFSRSLKKKTLLNYHIGLSSLWSWAVTEELVEEHILRKVTAPEPEQVAVVPFTEQEIKLLLLATERSKNYRRKSVGQMTNNTLSMAPRNKAIIYTLLDTGIRASELCNARLRELDLEGRQITVTGKGSKTRTVPFSPRTARVLWRYLSRRPEAERRPRDPIFAGEDNAFMERNSLYKLLVRIGERAGVKDVHPHRFRHTFAITYLRNGGNVYALQRALGHTSLDMVKRYLLLSEQDDQNVHRLASPVANWNL